MVTGVHHVTRRARVVILYVEVRLVEFVFIHLGTQATNVSVRQATVVMIVLLRSAMVSDDCNFNMGVTFLIIGNSLLFKYSVNSQLNSDWLCIFTQSAILQAGLFPPKTQNCADSNKCI